MRQTSPKTSIEEDEKRAVLGDPLEMYLYDLKTNEELDTLLTLEEEQDLCEKRKVAERAALTELTAMHPGREAFIEFLKEACAEGTHLRDIFYQRGDESRTTFKQAAKLRRQLEKLDGHPSNEVLHEKIVDTIINYRFHWPIIENIYKKAEKGVEEDNPIRLAYLSTHFSERTSARNILATMNLRLVIAEAKKLERKVSIGFDELIAEGNGGLLKAADRFDADEGNRFSTCAGPWIRQAMTRGNQNTERIVRLPVHLIELAGKMLDTIRERENEGLFPLNYQELASKYDSNVETVRAVLLAYHHGSSLDVPANSSSKRPRSLASLIADERELSDSEVVTLHLDLAEALEQLPDRQREILELRYGFQGKVPLGFNQMKNELGIGKETARKDAQKAYQSLKEILLEYRGVEGKLATD